MELQEIFAAMGCSEEFIPAFEQFVDMVRALGSEEMSMMEHSKVEEWVGKSGNETNRRLLQAYCDRCAVKEPVFEGVTGADGVTRDHREYGCERNLMTLFGRTVVRRQCYDKRGGKKLYPLDGALNLPPDLYSLALRRRVAEGAMLNSFDEVTANVQRTTGGKVPKRQAEELVEKAAQDFQAFYGGRQAQAAEVTSDPLIMSLDGKGIRMRPASLRECTRKAAERDAHKMRTRLSPGEKGNRKRMSTVATGVIEGACRHLVKDRLDLTGARWGLEGAEAVLRLRSLHSSHGLEEYWDFHIAQELQRNHLVRYEQFPFQKAA